jgi:hypothetical protein
MPRTASLGSQSAAIVSRRICWSTFGKDLRDTRSTAAMAQLTWPVRLPCEADLVALYLVAYNLARLLMARAASLAEQMPHQLFGLP